MQLDTRKFILFEACLLAGSLMTSCVFMFIVHTFINPEFSASDWAWIIFTCSPFLVAGIVTWRFATHDHWKHLSLLQLLNNVLITFFVVAIFSLGEQDDMALGFMTLFALLSIASSLIPTPLCCFMYHRLLK